MNNSKIVGHRGAKEEKPENTLLGFEYAFSCGVDALELDIHKSSDEHLVVIHDETLDRTTKGQGEVKNFSLKKLKEIDESIPTLREVLKLFKGNGKEILIEIKAQGCEHLLMDMIKEFEFSNQAIIKSFNHRILEKIRKLDNSVRIFPLIYALPLNPINIIESVDAQGISVSINTIDEDLVKECSSKSYQVCTWNANNIEQINTLKRWGVDYICTDFPSLILK